MAVIDSVEKAADFVSRYGNVSPSAASLLAVKPAEWQLGEAYARCRDEVEQAFVLLRQHYAAGPVTTHCCGNCCAPCDEIWTSGDLKLCERCAALAEKVRKCRETPGPCTCGAHITPEMGD